MIFLMHDRWQSAGVHLQTGTQQKVQCKKAGHKLPRVRRDDTGQETPLRAGHRTANAHHQNSIRAHPSPLPRQRYDSSRVKILTRQVDVIEFLTK